LNYQFVVSSPTAVSQIFSYLPQGLSHGLTLDGNQVVMQYLQPYNTLDTMNFITTLAMAYIPTDKVDSLSIDILNPNGALYTNPNPSVVTLMGMVDSSIPILPGSQLPGGGTPVNSGNSAATTSSAPNDDGTPGNSDTGSSPVRPSSVGIAVGAVAGATVYGAAMFLVARRYKKRKSGHQRSSSMQSGSSRGARPGESSNLMAAGARGSYGTRYGGRTSRGSDHSDSQRSGRTYISPPVMAENSLGWN
jgi:hypothetical protein